MRFTAKAEYACLAMMELATDNSSEAPKRVREIAEARGIPERYLVQILQQLKTAGLVLSVRGAVGGYNLSRNAMDISIAEIIIAIDGPEEPPRKPTVSFAPKLIELFNRARQAEHEILASTKLAELVSSPALSDWTI